MSAFNSIERLESRRLLSATPSLGLISGVVFNDLNASGVQDAHEPGLANVKVFVDLKHTGAYVYGDPVCVTNASGAYKFGDLHPATYVIGVQPPAGYQEDFPFAAPEYTLNVGAGTIYSGKNFGLTTTSHIAGTVYSNATGKLVGLAGVTVSITAANGTGGTFVRTTDSVGYFGIGGLPNTAYKVTVTAPGGFMIVGNSSITTPTLKSGQNDNAVNFTLTPSVVFGASSRFVDVQDVIDSSLYPNPGYPTLTKTASGASAFNATISSEQDSPYFMTEGNPDFIDVSGTASQKSTLTSGEITDSGNVTAFEDDLGYVGSSYGQGESFFQTTFTLKTAQKYSFSTVVTDGLDYGDGPGGMQSLTLTGPGGIFIVNNPNGTDANPVNVQKSGTLAAGTYTLTFQVTATDNDNRVPTDSYVLDMKFGG